METKNEDKSAKAIIYSIFLILILLTSIIITVIFVRQKLSLISSAKYYGDNNASLDNSYIFASPIRAKTGGDLIRVTVFLLDGNGLGVSDKTVSLREETGLMEIKPLQPLTDDTGKALFDVYAQKSGYYTIRGLVESKELPQSVKVIFD